MNQQTEMDSLKDAEISVRGKEDMVVKIAIMAENIPFLLVSSFVWVQHLIEKYNLICSFIACM